MKKTQNLNTTKTNTLKLSLLKNKYGNEGILLSNKFTFKS